MSRAYSRLAKLQRELMAAQTAEEREVIEDEIAELEDEIDEEESSKYGSGEDDY
jgi:hypothetical protein